MYRMTTVTSEISTTQLNILPSTHTDKDHGDKLLVQQHEIIRAVLVNCLHFEKRGVHTYTHFKMYNLYIYILSFNARYCTRMAIMRPLCFAALSLPLPFFLPVLTRTRSPRKCSGSWARCTCRTASSVGSCFLVLLMI